MRSSSFGMTWCVLGFLVGLASIMVIPYRKNNPEQMLWISCALTIIFPLDALMPLMLLTSVVARTSQRKVMIRATTIAVCASLWSQVRDALQPDGSSIWKMWFTPAGDSSKISPISRTASDTTVVLTAVTVTLISVALAMFIGLHIRSRSNLKTEMAKVDAARSQAASLQTDLNNKQISDAIAAEAHDTLANSLTLISLNANALMAQARQLNMPDTNQEQSKAAVQNMTKNAEMIQKKAKEALDEAHDIIGMLRDPQAAAKTLMPTDETSLTAASLNQLVRDARTSGTQLSTWIDIHQLSELNPQIGKVAYRVAQEGLTNARRHAPGQPVALQIIAAPNQGVHVSVSNPEAAAESNQGISAGNGLKGLTERTKNVGGNFSYGLDTNHEFTISVTLPWIFQTTATPPSNTTGTRYHRHYKTTVAQAIAGIPEAGKRH